MTTAVAGLPQVRRELGACDQGCPGPTLLVLAGVHGNEPAGVEALQRVLQRLQGGTAPLRGRLLGLGGNLPALAQGVRYLDRDLNRRWLAPQVEALQAQAPALDGSEDRQQRELLQHFERAVATARGPLVFVDLHTSSADGPPFLCLADTSDNRRVGLATGVPLLLGLEELIDGAALEWFSSRGLVGLAVEGGRSGHPDTVGNHEAVLWLLLTALGMLPPGAVDLAAHRAHLQRTTRGLPPVVEIFHRQAITPADGFVMAPGFVNLQAVAADALLAHDVRGEVRSPCACRVVLPLYQAKGDDGFFLGRPVRGGWQLLARGLRRLRLHRLASWLPGVARDPQDPRTVLVTTAAVRRYGLRLFHLLGYCKERRRGDRLAFTRRWSLPHNRGLCR